MFAEQSAFEALNCALFNYADRQVRSIAPSDRFAHYTSRDVVEKIICGDEQGKRYLWLRNSRLMNDFSEVEWGQDCLQYTLKNWRMHERFKRVLNVINKDLYDRIKASLESEANHLGDNAFLLSLTLHNQSEALTGKLSMWRAYGLSRGGENACLVFNTAPFLNRQTAFETVLSPVMYGGKAEFADEFEGVLYRLELSAAELKNLSSEVIFLNLKRALDFAVLSTKHPGFHEEKEWRVIHQPSTLRPAPPAILDPSDSTKKIHLIPLENRLESGIWGANPNESLERIIIGPTGNAAESREHYIKLLTTANVTHASDRVISCEIPLRR